MSTSSIFHKLPQYVVLFSVDSLSEENFLAYSHRRVEDEDNVTVPHGMDRDLAAALPALWYCLHLPNSFHQIGDIDANVLKRIQALNLDHLILPIPIDLFDPQVIKVWPEWSAPALVISPDDLFDKAVPKAHALGFPLPVAKQSSLSDESLEEHWRLLHAHFTPEREFLGRVPKLTTRFDMAPTELPRRWLARQMGYEGESIAAQTGDRKKLVENAIWEQLVLASIARLEEEGATPEEADEAMPRILREESPRLNFPVALALPGVSSVYQRAAFEDSVRKRVSHLPPIDEEDVWPLTYFERPDHLIERNAIEFVVSHYATARGGAGLMLPSVPSEAFTILTQLERHFMGNAKPLAIRKLLDRLNKAASIWSEELLNMLAHARSITVFSNFPIGLLTAPGDSSPLCTRIPICYRPIIPLTRTVQKELESTPGVDLSSGYKILVVECISREDPVGRVSRDAWALVKDTLAESNVPFSFGIREVSGIDELRQVIDDESPEILVISAHGARNPKNLTGLVIGEEFCDGEGLGPLPPVVILSACHVSPRGMGDLSIADLLIREGAIAVLGTQVPVDVYHNSLFMGRFFSYLAESALQRSDHQTLLELWQYVQTSNAVNDIIGGSEALRKWGLSATDSGLPVIQEFMMNRATGNLRHGHIYRDTEDVLGRIADDQGIGNKVRNWFRSPGYVPESLFYILIGRPERVLLGPWFPPGFSH